MSDEVKPPAPPAQIPGRKKTTMKEEKFVRALVATGDKTAAIREAYNVSPGNESAMILAVTKRPVVQRRIEEILAKRYPEHEDDYAELLRLQVKRAKEGQMSPRDVNDLMRLINETMGYKAPTQSQTLKATTVLKLPS